VGHLAYGDGIPDRLSRREPVSRAIILNANEADGLGREMGDYLVLTEKNDLPPAGKLGVFLELESSPPKINGFADGSGAAKAGVESGDLLLSIDGEAINSYADIRIALIDKLVGEVVEVEIERERLLLGKTLEKFSVTLN
jgi:S1-C subfamily serine protease